MEGILQSTSCYSDRLMKERDYWLEKLAGELIKSNFPYDYTITDGLKSREETVNFKIEGDVFSGLIHLSNGSDTRLFILLAAGVNTLLYRYTGNEDIIIGIPIKKQEIEGDFINTVLMLRNQLNGEMSFKDLILLVRQTLKEADENPNYPIEQLLYQLDSSFAGNSNSLFDVAALMENIHDRRHIEKLQSSMVLAFNRKEGCIEVSIQYNSLLYRRDTVERIGTNLINLFSSAANNVNTTLDGLEILSDNDIQKLLYEFNNTKAEYPENKTLHKIFEEQVEKTSENIAVIIENEHMTYRELNTKANNLAMLLRSKGVKADSIVGIMVERSFEMMIGIMAILKAGGAYMPISLEYPESRILYMLKDSKAVVLLTTEKIVKGCSYDGEVVLIDRYEESGEHGSGSNLEYINKSFDLAYVIYTSGSTGEPKGVMIEHASVINRLNWMQKRYPINENDVILQKTPYTFDVSVWELFWWAFQGASVRLLKSGEEKDAAKILEAIEGSKVTTIHFVPSMLNVFMEYLEEYGHGDKLASLKYVFASGEALNVLKVQRFIKLINNVCGAKLYNLYGPTEATVDVSYFDCPMSGEMESIPIGRPIDNTRLYIVDKKNSLLPPSVPGELCIAGDGLARGYLNKPQLTDEKFVNSPFIDGERIYKTGDLARWRLDGNIEYLGRLDFQVKIRGFRVELEEIEADILKHEYVKDVLVVAKEESGGEKSLCAYVVAKQIVEIHELKEYLLKRLPDYMIPTYFIFLDEMPINANGKIDRKALPDPGIYGTQKKCYEAPSNELEKRMLAVWEEVLEGKNFGVNDNFFEVGGHSLKATILISRIHKEFNVSISLNEIFNSPNIKGLARYIRDATTQRYISIEPVEKRAHYLLSSAQKRLFILNRLNGDSISYNMPLVMLIEGCLDRENFENAFKQLVRRHESLRTYFEILDKEPVQKIEKNLDFQVNYLAFGEMDIEDTVKAFIRPFNLGKAPLMRASIAELSENKYMLLFDMHHIISDGVSINILLKEFMDIYAGGSLPGLNLQYKDFAVWQNALIETEHIKAQEKYWLDIFKGDIPVLNLHTDHPRPAMQSFEGDNVNFKLDKELSNDLKSLALQTGTTLYMVLLAAYSVFLYRYTMQEDIVIGTPIAGRNHADLGNIVGMFVNTLAMRNFPEGDKHFVDFLSNVKENVIKAFENQDYQFEELIDKLNIPRDLSRNSLFDTLFVMQNTGIVDMRVEGLKFTRYDFEYGVTKFDLTLEAIEEEDGIEFNMGFCVRLFDKGTIERMVCHFIYILREVVMEPKIKLCEIDILSQEEKRQLVYEFNDTKVEYMKDKVLHEIFEEKAEQIPDSIAAVFESRELSYGELNQRANQLARVLTSKGVCPGNIVALMVERSLEMMIGIMGILKAGGCYLPINTKDPVERIQYILKDCGTDLILTKGGLCEKLDFDGTVIKLEDESLYHGDCSNLGKINTSSDLAYIIYTSGSTGNPKGVMIEHRSVINRLNWMQKQYIIGIEDVLLQKTPYTFDVSVWELFWWLFNGAKVCFLVPDGEKEPVEIVKAIEKYKVTVIHFVPSMLTMFLDYLETYEVHNRIASLNHIFASGEALSLQQVKRCNELLLKNYDIKLHNLYGPTEATVDVTFFDCSMIGQRHTVPIGRPIDNISMYVLDGNSHLQPLGVPGELCISGDGVAKGYLNRPELTAEKFVEDPFVYGERMYRTGDLARWMPDGNIEYLGRIDSQVKLRGLRIELSEIEAQLLKYGEIREAVVLINEETEDNKYICAYLVVNTVLDDQDLKKFLLKFLPEYMIPAFFIYVDKIPVTTNGKVNKMALKANKPKLTAEDNYVAPQNKTEEKLVIMWQDILNAEKVGINNNFFKEGGHSLKATALALRIYKEFGVEVSLAEIFTSPTIKELARLIIKSDEAYRFKEDNVILLKKGSDREKHIFFIHDGTGETEGYIEFCNCMNAEYNLWGIKAQSFKGYSPQKLMIEDIAAQYITNIKRIQPCSPYHIAGWSIGGTIAFEIGRRLEQDGHEVGFLGIFDAAIGQKELIAAPVEFNLQSEISFIKDIISDEYFENNPEKLKDIETLWLAVIEYFSKREVKQEVVELIGKIQEQEMVSGLKYADAKILIYYLNIIRSFENARALYSPVNSIKAQLCYFKAAESTAVDENLWNQYCEKTIKTYIFNGGHYTIFKGDNAIVNAKVFENVLRND